MLGLMTKTRQNASEVSEVRVQADNEDEFLTNPSSSRFHLFICLYLQQLGSNYVSCSYHSHYQKENIATRYQALDCYSPILEVHHGGGSEPQHAPG